MQTLDAGAGMGWGGVGGVVSSRYGGTDPGLLRTRWRAKGGQGAVSPAAKPCGVPQLLLGPPFGDCVLVSRSRQVGMQTGLRPQAGGTTGAGVVPARGRRVEPRPLSPGSPARTAQWGAAHGVLS